VLRDIDNPIRKHAAALAAKRNDGDGDRPYSGDLCVHRRLKPQRNGAASDAAMSR